MNVGSIWYLSTFHELHEEASSSSACRNMAEALWRDVSVLEQFIGMGLSRCRYSDTDKRC